MIRSENKRKIRTIWVDFTVIKQPDVVVSGVAVTELVEVIVVVLVEVTAVVLVEVIAVGIGVVKPRVSI